MQPKIKQLTVRVTDHGALWNAAATDETGQFRGDVTSGKTEDIAGFIAQCESAAQEVKLDFSDLLK